MDNRIALGVISVFVVLVVIGSALTPMIDAYTTTTITIENEGAVGLRMDKVTSGDFTLTYGLVGDDFTATNGTDAQIIDDMCIFYADDNVAVWMDDSSVRMLGKNANDQTIDAALSDNATITITKSANGVIITDGTVDQIFPVPTWAYVPKSTGTYGFFLNETEINTGGLDVHYIGSFAGVNCYDSINTYDLPITLDATVTDSILTGAKWIKAAAADPETELTPLEPASLIPLDPGVISIDPEPDVSIMAVPTPTYTDGDWGYDLVDGKAVIVSYSGTGGGIITVPATIGGYAVDALGKGTSNNNVFDTSLVATGLIISEGITKVNSYACKGCTNFTGNLVLPSTLTDLSGYGQFESCKFTGILEIPEGVTTIGGMNSFQRNAFEKIILPSTLTSIGPQVFQFMENNLKTVVFKSSVDNIGYTTFGWDYNLENLVIGINSDATLGNNIFNNTPSNTRTINVLNLGEMEITQNFSGMLGTQDIRTEITALGYLAPTSVNETVTDDGPVAALLHAIPLIAIIAVVMMAVGVFIAHRME